MGLISRYMGLVKFEHTVFAMPFALVGLLTASAGRPAAATLLWVLAAMVGARSAAMAFNRILDRHIDARNPRTAARHLPSGQVSLAGAAALTIASSALLVLAASQLNSLCLLLSPVALATVFFYSFTKRFTAWSHLFLGLGLAVAPVGAWLAVTGVFAPFPLLIAAGVLLWVAGFDTIYGCQDLDFDRREGLKSLAVSFGVAGALRLARLFHVLALAALAAALLTGPGLGAASLGGLAVMTVLLALEHRLVRSGDLKHIDTAFFTMNSWSGMAVLAGVLIDLYLI